MFGYTFGTKDYILAGSVLLNLILLAVFYRKYYYNHTPFVKVTVHRYRKDLPEFMIKIRNTGIIPIELDPPVVVFKKKGGKRLFQVRTGNVNGFPVALFRKDEYEFVVDLARFYTTDSSLITYRKVILEVKDKNQVRLAKRRIKIK